MQIFTFYFTLILLITLFFLHYNTLTTFHIHVYLFMYDFYYVNLLFLESILFYLSLL